MEFPSDDARVGRWMTNVIVEMIRDNVRKQVMEAIKPDIDKAVDEAVKDIQVDARRFIDHTMGETIVKFVIDDRRKKER